MRTARPLVVVLGIALAMINRALAETPAELAEQPRASVPVVVDGDPLPPGALSRMGEVRCWHGWRIGRVAFSPDGKTLASASHDHTVRLWETATGKEIRAFLGHRHEVHSLAFSSDGKTLASAEQTIRLWETATGKEVRALTGHQHMVHSVAFSPDGKTLASGSNDNTIRLWETATGKEIRVLRTHQSWVSSVAFAPDGKTLASASHDATIRLWDTATGKENRVLHGHQALASVAFSPDGKSLASGGFDHTIRLWEAASGQEIRTLKGHQEWVISVAFAADGKTLASTSNDRTLRLWETATGTEIRVLQLSSYPFVAFSPDGKTLAVANNGRVRLWEAATGKEIYRSHGHQDSVTSVAFSPDGKTLASASDDRTIRLWEPASGKEIRALHGHEDEVDWVAFSPDGKSLAAVSDGTVSLWDVGTGKFRGQDVSGVPVARWPELLRSMKEPLPKSMKLSPDGKTMASGSSDNTIRLSITGSGEKIYDLQGHQGRVLSVAFSPDGKTLVSGSSDQTVRLWATTTGKEIRALRGQSDPVHAVVFSPDGKTLATAGGWKIQLWETATGRKIRDCAGHRGHVSAVAFSPDGKTLASASDDNTVLLWAVNGSPTVPTTPRTTHRLSDLWARLADADVAKAHDALRALIAAPRQAVPFLEQHLKAGPPVDTRRQAALIADLDSGHFAVRQKATQELEKLGSDVVPALRQKLMELPGLEMRQRLEKLLERLRGAVPSAADMRISRAVQVLEYLGDTEARQLLDKLAQGEPSARLTEEAIAARERLSKRTACD